MGSNSFWRRIILCIQLHFHEIFLHLFHNFVTWTFRTPARTHSISGLKSRVLKSTFFSWKVIVKSGLEFIFKLTESLQRYLLTCQANSALMGRFFGTGQQQLWRGSVNFKINSRPLFTIIFKLKNVNFKTRDFCPLIKWVLAGVEYTLCTLHLQTRSTLVVVWMLRSAQNQLELFVFSFNSSTVFRLFFTDQQ